MATIQELYNLNEARTQAYIQKFVLQASDKCRKYLDHIPKKDSLYVEDLTTGEVFTIINNGAPKQGEVFYDYRSEYDYVSAKGMLTFNAEDAESGDEFQVRYIPVASRIDAEVINKLIEHNNKYDENIWTKDDLKTPAKEDIIAWTAINGRPEDATEEVHGLLRPEDQKILNAIPKPFDPPTSGVKLKGLDFKADTWGDLLKFDFEPGINIIKENDKYGKISLDGGSIVSLIGLTQAEIAALPGAVGEGKSATGPGESNKYVLDNDVRLTDYRHPLAHEHAIADVLNLQAALDSKSDDGHTHAASEITGIEYLKGEDGKSPEVTVHSTVTTAAGTDAKVTNVTGNPYNVQLKFEIPKGVDGKMVLNWEDWESLTEEQKNQIRIRGPKGDTGDGAAVSIDKIETGQEGSQVTYVVKDPVEKYWESVGRTLMTTGLELTIPRGTTGEQGIGGAVEIGSVTTSASGSDAQVVIHEPTQKEIGGVLYNTSKIDFTLPRGPKGTGTVSEISFSADTGWSTIDSDENYTLTIPTAGAIPVSLAYEEVGSGNYDVVIATVRFNYNKIYIIADHKFSGKIYVDGAVS